MSRGMGIIQRGCLKAIQQHDGPTTYTIAADVYAIRRDRMGNRWISDAQHAAVRRALNGLRRKGLITGYRDTEHSRLNEYGQPDGRIELCHRWFLSTERQERAL